MYRYEHGALSNRIEELTMEESNWARYYLEFADNLPRCQIEVIRERINQIRNERERLLHDIWEAE